MAAYARSVQISLQEQIPQEIEIDRKLESVGWSVSQPGNLALRIMQSVGRSVGRGGRNIIDLLVGVFVVRR